MFCSRCGNQVEETFRFCHICGNTLIHQIPPASIQTEAFPPNHREEPKKPASLIKNYQISEDLRKYEANLQSLDLFEDRVVAKNILGETILLPFEKYFAVSFIPAGKETQYAQVILISKDTPAALNQDIYKHNLHFPNKLSFCSGLLNIQPANVFAEALMEDIQSALHIYHGR